MENRTLNLKACVGIAPIVGAINLSIVALLAIFSPANLLVAAWVGVPLCFMGVALAYLGIKN